MHWIVDKGIPPLQDEEKWSEGLRSFWSLCLTVDQTKRPSAATFLSYVEEGGKKEKEMEKEVEEKLLKAAAFLKTQCSNDALNDLCWRAKYVAQASKEMNAIPEVADNASS